MTKEERQGIVEDLTDNEIMINLCGKCPYSNKCDKMAMEERRKVLCAGFIDYEKAIPDRFCFYSSSTTLKVATIGVYKIRIIKALNDKGYDIPEDAMLKDLDKYTRKHKRNRNEQDL